jgi:2,4-dienoyl-CoA reductase-like NADH-dependent reductase (Old Yellow Enzyme family)
VSQGLRGKGYAETEFRMQIKRTDQEGYFGEWTRAVKDVVSVPTMVVGGLRSFERMEEIVESGGSDFVSMSRPLIREPGLVKAWQEGGRDRAKCISCNQCLEAIRAGESLHCVQEREKGEEISK